MKQLKHIFLIAIFLMFYELIAVCQYSEDYTLFKEPLVQNKPYFFEYELIEETKEAYRRKELLTIEIEEQGVSVYIDESKYVSRLKSTGGSLDVDWEEIGPTKDISVCTKCYCDNNNTNTLGRIDYIGFPDPNDMDKILACSPAGGLFKSNDGGDTWVNAGTDQGLKIEDDIVQCGVSFVAFDPIDIDNVWYIATGNAHDAYPFPQSSDGIFRTIDGGVTWQHIGLTESTLIPAKTDCKEKHYINKIFATSSGKILVASEDGLWKCTNALDGTPYGSNPTGTPQFDKVINDQCFDIEHIPGTTKYFITTRGNFCIDPVPNIRLVLHVFDDFDNSFVTYTNGNTFAERDVRTYHTIEVSKCDPGRAYILEIDGSNGATLHNLYRLNYEVGSGNNITFEHMGQLWNDEHGLMPDALAVSPTNKDIILVGTCGAKYQDRTVITIRNASTVVAPNLLGKGDYIKYITHADVCHITYSPDGSEVWAGTDGGVVKVLNSDTLGVWESKNDSLSITTMYNIDVNQASPLKVITGQQDCGSNLLYKDTNGDWVQEQKGCGDGGPCVFNYNDDSEFFYDTQSGLRRYLNSVDPHIVYWVSNGIINEGVWSGVVGSARSVFSAATPISVSGHTIGKIAVSKNPSHSNYIYAGLKSDGNNKILKSVVGGGTNQTNWITLECPYADEVGGWNIIVDYFDPNHIWVFHGWINVYSVNTTTNIWTPLPQSEYPLGFHNIIQDIETNTLYFNGREYGMYFLKNGAITCTDYTGNLPHVDIREAKINFKTRQIVAGTWGRGVWAAPLACDPYWTYKHLGPIPIDTFMYASNLIFCDGSVSDGVRTFLQAGNKIEFKPGFSTGNNCILNAFIQPCTSSTKSTSNKEVEIPDYDQTTGTAQSSRKENLKVFPNPSTGVISIQFDENISANSAFEVYDIQGRRMDQKIISNNAVTYDFQGQKGVFFIKLIVNNKVYTSKVVVK